MAKNAKSVDDEDAADVSQDASSDTQTRDGERDAQDAIDAARGYRARVLRDGRVDFEALHDHWTSPSEATMREHVEAYKSATSSYLTEPTIIITNQ